MYCEFMVLPLQKLANILFLPKSVKYKFPSSMPMHQNCKNLNRPSVEKAIDVF